MSDSHKLYDELVSKYKEYSVLSTVQGVLHWDMQVIMPPEGAGRRAEQLAILAGLSHEKLTAGRIGELIDKLNNSPNGLSEAHRANIREIARDYQLATKLPKEFVEEFSRVKTLAHEIWAEARTKADFGHFAPHLEKLVALSKQAANYYGYKDHPYDALIDQFEPGGTAKMFTKLFDEVKAANIPLLNKILHSSVKANRSILNRDYPADLQKKFGEQVMTQVGFNTKAGRLDVSVHPFCSGGKGDIRITTRYNEQAPQQALFGVIHETGHALYEQEVSGDYLFTPLGEALSMGMHESQSRMWENFIGRGKPFWKHFYAKWQAIFPQQTRGVSMEDFLLAINHVERSFVRVEADEMTYDLHIILRFEIERDLIGGQVSVNDLPTVWNKKMQDYLGITPPNNGKEGVLQDVHWSEAYFGYFPSYSLGNMIAGQLWNTMRNEIAGIDAKIENGQFSEILNWLREKVHLHGRRFGRDELLTKATGSALDTQHYTGYLSHKFGELYQL